MQLSNNSSPPYLIPLLTLTSVQFFKNIMTGCFPLPCPSPHCGRGTKLPLSLGDNSTLQPPYPPSAPSPGDPPPDRLILTPSFHTHTQLHIGLSLRLDEDTHCEETEEGRRGDTFHINKHTYKFKERG